LLALVLWDDLLPTPLDYLILRPQPIPWRTVVLAKLLAWGVLMSLFMAVVNLVSCSMLPIVNTADQVTGIYLLRRMGAHALGVAAGSAWMFLWIAAIRGAVALVGDARQWARAARLALTAAFLAAIVVSPELTEPSIYHHLALHPPWWCAPLFWFLGIAHGLNGRAAPAAARSRLPFHAGHACAQSAAQFAAGGMAGVGAGRGASVAGQLELERPFAEPRPNRCRGPRCAPRAVRVDSRRLAPRLRNSGRGASQLAFPGLGNRARSRAPAGRARCDAGPGGPASARAWRIAGLADLGLGSGLAAPAFRRQLDAAVRGGA